MKRNGRKSTGSKTRTAAEGSRFALTGRRRPVTLRRGGTVAAPRLLGEVSTLRLTVNEKTAHALGVTIPKSILVRADEAIR
jgi:hypothetical protein